MNSEFTKVIIEKLLQDKSLIEKIYSIIIDVVKTDKKFADLLLKKQQNSKSTIIPYHNNLDVQYRKQRLHVHPTVDIEYGSNLFNLYSGSITIGEYSVIGQRCLFLAGTHNMTFKNMQRAVQIPDRGYDINIGKGVFIGSGSIIIGPCDIQDHAVIGAGSVVTAGTYEKGCIYAGNPAVFKKRIEFRNE